MLRTLDEIANAGTKPRYVAGDDPWRLVEDSPAVRGDARSLLPYALVAPSAVNNQPWKFRLFEKGIELHRDTERAFSPIFVPNHRYVYIALGAATENLVIAGAHLGHRVELDYCPRGETADPTVVLRLGGETGSSSPSPLFSAIPKRHTNRKMYTGQTYGTELFRELKGIAEEDGFQLSVLSDRPYVEKIADMVGDANTRQFEDEAAYPLLHKWLRFSPRELAKTRDGMPIDSYNLDRPGNWFAHAGGMRPGFLKLATRIGMVEVYSAGYRKAVASSSAICLLSTRAPTPLSFLKGGRVFERIVLTLTSKGISYQPLMNLVEVGGSVEDLKDVHSLRDGEPVMHFRIGTAKEPAVVSPRRPIREVLL